MLRRLYHDQPSAFAYTPENRAWAEAQLSKYPEGRQASAVIPLLWRAQEQEGWLSQAAIEYVADMLDMAYIRVLEVATFYFMFQLQPVGSVAHIQICGTTSCMICGAEDLVAVCREKIADQPHALSSDGRFSWEEVECLGACANAPMAQIGKDYYEDLTAARLGEILDEMAAGQVPVPGPQNGRFSSEPLAGLSSLKEFESGRTKHNASVQNAVKIGDTIKRIDGTEVPLLAPWGKQSGADVGDTPAPDGKAPKADKKASKGLPEEEAEKVVATPPAEPAEPAASEQPEAGTRPAALDAARDGGPDDLKMIKGVGPKLESLLHDLGIYHFDQIAGWGPAEVAWMDDNLAGFKGRVSRDDWIDQARVLAGGGSTEFAARVKKGDVY